MTKEQLQKRKELLLRKKELLEKKAQLEASQQQQPPTPQEREPMSKMEAAKIGASEGLSFGFSDNIAGAVNGLLDDGMRATHALGLTGPSPKQQEEELAAKGFTGDGINPQTSAYEEGVESRRQDIANAREDHPYVTMAGDVAGSIPTAIATGGMSIPAQGAVMGVGYGDATNPLDMAKDAAGGALLAKATPLVGKAAKAVMPKKVNMVYNAIARKFKARASAATKRSIKSLEDKYKLFTGMNSRTITPELADGAVKELKQKLYTELDDITQAASQNVTPEVMNGKLGGLVESLNKMQQKVAKTTTDTELSQSLARTSDLFKQHLDAGDYQSLVSSVRNEIQDNYIKYMKSGEMKAPGIVKKEMNEFMEMFNKANKELLEEVVSPDAGAKFKSSMKDLADAHEVSALIKKNVDTELSMVPTTNDWVASGTIAYMSNQIIASAYMGGSMVLRNPAVQGFLAKTYGQVPRSYEGIKKLINSPVGGFLKENLPAEVVEGIIPKMEAGLQVPTVQQQLAVKGVVSMFPEFFEKSEYNSMVDGKITDPYEVGLEMDKIKSDESLSYIEKAKRARALNKDGTLLRGANTAKGEIAPVAPEEQQQVFNFLDTAGGQNVE